MEKPNKVKNATALRNSIEVTLLLSIGYVLHVIIPGYGAGMKPDMLLAMLFISILLKKDFKLAILGGFLAGLISAMTTTFPMGQLPNMIDKIVTSLIFFALVKLIGKLDKNIIIIALTTMVGTLVSGVVFLGSALMLFSLPAPFGILLMTVVLPATILNAVTVSIMYPLISKIRKQS